MAGTTAVLAVQGAFIEHERMLSRLGEKCVELRQASDLEQPFDRLVLPGGESTVQGKLLEELGMLDGLRRRIEEGMPVLATCAGLILLAKRLDAHDDKGTPRLSTLDVLVQRNAYGRQLGSFHTEGEVAGIGRVPMTFIRAPYVMEAGPGVEVLAQVDGRTVAVRQGSQLALAFHPELDESVLVHEAFLAI
ncbi:pyridoxal 5'-phosphate synthase glutaminase subunit PdxT [Paratractidigestivibacter faecalis]|uniref:pyridoxal 5'-phosphate synthase glutaminase subunit PdxT n=1 Tax=Paratractidigestivibacter faecalis TaxID=2292441 RepID=UPI001E64EAC9|nr:pyridoxal 5'-phosphate synthase glutaminase subunit PdxT [Paratractidigestivibacter faecalis]